MGKNIMEEIAKDIQTKIGKQYGFCVLVYEHNKDIGRMNYISNSNRNDLVLVMKEFIEKTENAYGVHKLK